MSQGEDAFLFCLRAFAPELPEPEREYKFHDTRLWRFDFCWPAKKLAVEIEGGQWVTDPDTGQRIGGRHNRPGAGFERDIEKYNHAAAYGFRVIRFTTQMLDAKPNECIQFVNYMYDQKVQEHNAYYP